MRVDTMVPLPDIVDMLPESIAEDATALGCTAECARARVIARDGSSADRQLALFEAALERGISERSVIDWLVGTTADPMA